MLNGNRSGSCWAYGKSFGDVPAKGKPPIEAAGEADLMVAGVEAWFGRGWTGRSACCAEWLSGDEAGDVP